MFIKNDSASIEELNNMIRYAMVKLDEAHISNLAGVRFIGTGGTVKTAGTVHKSSDYKNENLVDGLNLSVSDIEKVYTAMCQTGIEGRKSIPGLNPKRADVITAGMAILVLILKKAGAAVITVSSRGVIEGFIEDYVQKDSIC
jgi:exopolyphosphatase/guanosine-5'-triphosphate,3'-diphosphate pyrophosphatase